MSKLKRNDPCPCGSGKKVKKCCGTDNVIAFNSSFYTEEFDRLHSQLIDFSIEQNEEPLLEALYPFIQKFQATTNEEDFNTFVELLTTWAILTVPVANEKTVFDLFYAKQKSKIKHHAVKRTFATWKDSIPGAFAISSVDEEIKLIDMMTDKSYTMKHHGDDEYTPGDLAIGVLVPYSDSYEFFFSMFQLPATYMNKVSFLLEQKVPLNYKLSDVFPDFLTSILQLEVNSTSDWLRPDYALVAERFEEQATVKEYDEELIQMTINYWHRFCHINIPIVRSPAGHAAALDYFCQQEFMEFSDVTQAQLAKEYGTSAGTISTHYGRLLEEFELFLMELDLEEENEQPAPPSFNMEREMRNMTRMLKDQAFESEEELNAFLQGAISFDETPPPETPKDIAQDLLFDAAETHGAARTQLINKALAMYPLSPDAYALLADEARDMDQQMDLLEKAIDVGKQDLGTAFFEENMGHFWKIVETRPYMRAKFSYAICLQKISYTEEAIDVYQELLKLNPGDNQGVRYALLPLYISLEMFDEAGALIEEYDETTAVFMFSKALLHFEMNGITIPGVKMLKQAASHNPFVIDYLIGNKEIPNEVSDTIGFGDASEAIAYVQENVHLWADAEAFLKMV